ncbi:CRISPR-associated endonuclease Cas2 [Ruminococcus albus]|nr:CRISPR-associated endonuclease Cas2 [Ruminococcus albus]MCC3351795.1 CRISPR-associated endonuclease Cas2 [Ruminococcus albus 8]MCC3352918.1 CRISPR-associated endonuclease Cas2 [Ruminococcus albus 8]
MVNRFMRIMVFFDLPVTTKNDRKEYAKFRKFLINDGFIMIQFSVYSRTVRNHDDAKKHCKTIEANLPPKGSVRVLTVTEKQYDSMKLLVGERLKSENLLDKNDIIEL